MDRSVCSKCSQLILVNDWKGICEKCEKLIEEEKEIKNNGTIIRSCYHY